jgi:hypothetical protein
MTLYPQKKSHPQVGKSGDDVKESRFAAGLHLKGTERMHTLGIWIPILCLRLFLSGAYTIKWSGAESGLMMDSIELSEIKTGVISETGSNVAFNMESGSATESESKPVYEEASEAITEAGPDYKANEVQNQQLAFPGAQGFGRFTKGGRGGDVYYVTNLNDTGQGSLRHAIQSANGPRTIVFAVSGTIRLKSRLFVNNPYITIAGQTAPGEGIAVADYDFNVLTHDVIIRHMRFRRGDLIEAHATPTGYGHLDALDIHSSKNVMIDHVSASWGIDEVLSVVDAGRSTLTSNNITVQNSLITEALDNTYHPKSPHGYGSLVRGSTGSSYTFHHNLWAHHANRMPRIGNYVHYSEDPLGVLVDVRNNVFYNWGGHYSGYNSDDGVEPNRISVSKYNFINNYYKAGPNSSNNFAWQEAAPKAQAHFAGNAMNGRIPPDQWRLIRLRLPEFPEGYQREQPFDVEPVETYSAIEAYERVLARSGAMPRDAVDARVIQDVINGTGRIIDSQEEVGGWPALRSRPAPKDSDSDGMPDWWEIKHGLDPDDPSDRNGDRTGDGYTNLEEYLNWLADPGDYLLHRHPWYMDESKLVNEISLIQPPDQSADVELNPVFTWEEDSNAVTYQFQLFLEGHELIHDTLLADTLYELDLELNELKNYEWQVRGINEDGIEGPWSTRYTFATRQVTSTSRSEESVHVITLYQNYPNPFNPGTRIAFTLPEQNEVSLMIYDLLGRRVAVLLDGAAYQAGTHFVDFDAGVELNSGTYIYRLTLGSGEQVSRSLTILK